jgi:hypothetical protein
MSSCIGAEVTHVERHPRRCHTTSMQMSQDIEADVARQRR